ncbi:hypothetical protein CEXT_470541 [Caerostris extrusa]|uniref:CCHC-type domain-containing protein n=1 Tax=Caerostris extrusa TaxID=172846 RepID=A0AAV4RYS6_CAEEX|nr:hypothetical protein CEXT_470541 [Caerostris extrusa]
MQLKHAIYFQEQFEPKSRVSVIRLLDEFFQINFDAKDDSTAIFKAKIRKMVNHRLEMLNTLSKTCTVLFRLYGHSHRTLKVMLKFCIDDHKDFKFYKIEIEFVVEENWIRQLKSDMSKVEIIDNSIYTCVVNHKINKRNISDNSRVYIYKNKLKFTKSIFRKETGPRGPCYMCKKIGHLKLDC